MIDYNLQPIPNFSLREMRCKCGCGLVIMQPVLLECLGELRTSWGEPITVNSWIRCKEHNRAVGGKPNSYHLYGRAIDVMPSNGLTTTGFVDMCKRYFPYVLGYTTFCHCDIRGRRGL